MSNNFYISLLQVATARLPVVYNELDGMIFVPLTYTNVRENLALYSIIQREYSNSIEFANHESERPLTEKVSHPI